MSSIVSFGKYELVARLARGGMAETYRAQLRGAAGVTKQVVIKKVLPHFAEDELFVEAFINEARISASLSHGNIAQVFDFGEFDGDYFIAMELVDGRSLGHVLARAAEKGFTRLPPPIACFLAIEVLKGLHYAHTRVGPDGQPLSLVHRDVSPENVLIGFEGEVKVVDFGVAKAVMRGRRETEPGLVKGKFLYFSPEQALAAPVDARSDVYAVGILLYRMLCGGLPFEGQMHIVMRAIAAGRFTPPLVMHPGLPQPLAAVITRAMATKRDERFASALQMQEALAGHLYRQEPTFSSETVKEWMAWLFRPELQSDGRNVGLSGRFQDQLTRWGAAPADAVTAPQVALVRPEATAETVEAPGKVEPGPKGVDALWLAVGALVLVVGLGVGVVMGSEPDAPIPAPTPPPVALKPKVDAPDQVAFPSAAVVSGERHRLRVEQISLPEFPFGKDVGTPVSELDPQRGHAPLFVIARSSRLAANGQVALVLRSGARALSTFSALKVFDFQPFRESLGGQMRALRVGPETKSFSDTAAQIDGRSGAWVTVTGVKGRVRLTVSPMTPAIWASRPRKPSVVVAWQRTPGYRVFDDADWPGGPTRAVLTQGTPLDVEGAATFALAHADPLATTEADSVMVSFTAAPAAPAAPDPPTPSPLPVPVVAPAPAAEGDGFDPNSPDDVLALHQARLLPCFKGVDSPTPVTLKLTVALGAVVDVAIDPPPSKKWVGNCISAEVHQWQFAAQGGRPKTVTLTWEPAYRRFARRPGQKTFAAPPAAAAPLSSAFDACLAEGKRLFGAKQFVAARTLLQRCVLMSPGQPDAHKLLGSTWAKLGETQKAASEYREFVRLAPADHPDRPRVQGILSAFDAAEKR